MAETTTQAVQRFDWSLMLRGQFTRERFEQEAQRWVDRANALEREIAEGRERILRDPELNDRGKNQRIQQLRERLRPRVQQFVQQRDEIEAARQRALASREERMPAQRGEVVNAMRAQEIRAGLRGVEQGEIVRIYSEAGKRDDLETILAIEDQPMAQPVIDPDALESLREERLANKFPEQTDLADNQKAFVDLLAQMATHLERRVEE